MNPLDTTNLVAVWRDFRLGYRRVGYGYTFDGGLTWVQDLFPLTSYSRDSDPGITYDTAGNFYAVILSFNTTSEPNGLFVYKSTDGGVTWNGPDTVIDGAPGVFEDKELIACDRSNSAYTGNLYVTWTRFGYDTEILMCRSTDGGNTFVGPVSISDVDGVQWPVPAVGPNGEVYIAWVQYSGSIKFDRSTDGGQTFGTDITLQPVSFVSGNINGRIMVFSFPAMDVDITGGPNNGNIYVAYMDYSSRNTDTDIYFTKSTDGGNTWSQKQRINDDPVSNGCDQFHPWLTVAPDGSIIVVFLDRRRDPNNLLMDLYMTTSTDGGNTWSPNERITTVSSDPTAGLFKGDPAKYPIKIDHPVITAGRSGLIGEYICVTASSINDIHQIWTDTRLGNQDVFVGVADTTQPGIAEVYSDHSKSPLLNILSNPGSKNIRFQVLSNETSVKRVPIKIYDTTGRLVDKFYALVNNTIIWDRKDKNGNYLRPGVYFWSVESSRQKCIKKFVLTE